MRPIPFLLCVLAVIAAPLASGAQDIRKREAVLSQPGNPVELAGLYSRVIAFYEPQGDRLRLTLLISGATSGGGVLRAGATLADGQSYAIRSSGQGRFGEEFAFRREGGSIRMEFVPTGDMPVADGDPAADPVAASEATALVTAN